MNADDADRSDTALLMIDWINDFDFDGGEDLLRHAGPAARVAEGLADRCRRAGVPVIYANDNFGRWQSEFGQVLDRCQSEGCRGRDLVRRLAPRADDYSVLKPAHSAFFGTSLELLLRELGTRRLILSGVAGDICVLFTASDAFMRGFEVVVPRDAVASESRESNDHALRQIARACKAQTPAAAEVELER